jgi:hypothetical protein
MDRLRASPSFAVQGHCETSQSSTELYVACTEQSEFENRESKLEQLQARLNVVREVFGNKRFPSMIAALKQAIAIYADDPAWRTVRPPLIEFTPEQAKMLARELKGIGFAMPGIAKVVAAGDDCGVVKQPG